MKYIVPITCHFEDESHLCKTTLLRLDKSIQVSDIDDYFIIAGDVPYEKGSKTLSELSWEYLVHKGIVDKRIRNLKGGVGTFSEARILCNEYKGEELVIVSSSWYLFQAKPIFKKRAKENNIKISFVSIKNTAGLQTWITYICLGILVRITMIFMLDKYFEKIMAGWQKVRVDSFAFNGCK